MSKMYGRCPKHPTCEECLEQFNAKLQRVCQERNDARATLELRNYEASEHMIWCRVNEQEMKDLKPQLEAVTRERDEAVLLAQEMGLQCGNKWLEFEKENQRLREALEKAKEGLERYWTDPFKTDSSVISTAYGILEQALAQAPQSNDDQQIEAEYKPCVPPTLIVAGGGSRLPDHGTVTIPVSVYKAKQAIVEAAIQVQEGWRAYQGEYPRNEMLALIEAVEAYLKVRGVG